MRRRAFLWLGGASICAGVLHQTSAFSSLNAGRGVSVSAVEDENGALLGIKHSDDESVLPVFENNSSSNMKVELPNGDFDPSEFPLSSGASQGVDIVSDSDVENAQITATLYDGGTPGNLFEDGEKTGEITLQRDFSQQVIFGIDGSIAAEAPQGGQIEFDVETNGDRTATITGYEVEIQDPLSADINWNDQNSEIPDQFNDPVTVLLDRFTQPDQGNSPADIVIESTDFASPPSDGDIIVTLQLDVENEGEVSVDIGIKASAG